MEKKFGEFVREKRLERGLKLKVFAELVGISPVYESYIENGKRPAPSQAILQRIAANLQLHREEEICMYSLAEFSRRQSDFHEDVWDYITSRSYVFEALQSAIKNKATEQQWTAFKQIIECNKSELHHE